MIGGQHFVGVLRDEGPYLAWGAANVPIGVASLRRFKPPPRPSGRPLPKGWWVIKNHHELRMDLHSFTNAEAQMLASEFGIIVFDTKEDFSAYARRDCFFTSPAWEGLRIWVMRHPHLARTVGDDYFLGWRSRVEKVVLEGKNRD